MSVKKGVKKIKILCFDQATRITGYSVFEDNKLIAYGTLKANPNEKNYIERLKEMNEMIVDLIEKAKPDYVVIEEIQYQNNQLTYKQLSQLQGIIMAYLFKIDIGFTIIEPSAWKAFCNIKGKKRDEQKTNTIKFVKAKFGIDVSEDEADAISIGIWAINYIKGRN